jgi:hypothetical protein
MKACSVPIVEERKSWSNFSSPAEKQNHGKDSKPLFAGGKLKRCRPLLFRNGFGLPMLVHRLANSKVYALSEPDVRLGRPTADSKAVAGTYVLVL